MDICKDLDLGVTSDIHDIFDHLDGEGIITREMKGKLSILFDYFRSILLLEHEEVRSHIPMSELDAHLSDISDFIHEIQSSLSNYF